MSYQNEYLAARDNPQAFWLEKANKLAWFRAPTKAFDPSSNNWFSDGQINICHAALDHHIEEGRGNQAAFYYDSPVTGNKDTITYQQLFDEVRHFAGVLRDQGVQRGDRVVIYMPMIPQAAIAMLAVARLGAVHSVVFGGFAAHELAVRIEDATPKVVISASHGIEVSRLIEYKPLLDKALEKSSHQPDCCIVFNRTNVPAEKQVNYTLVDGRDYDWAELMKTSSPADAVAVNSDDPLYILYTSGTTGKPKGVVRDHGGYATALHYSMGAVYNCTAGDTIFTASDVGWVVGHSFIVYGPLLAGCSSVLYEGKPVFTPNAGAFWRICEDYRIKALFAAPTAFRAIRKEDPEGQQIESYDLSELETIFMAGERLDPATYEWTREKTNKPVVDHWWQTETGWPVCANLMGVEALTVKPGSATVPVPGYQVCILDDGGQPIANGEQGNIAIRLPLPPGCLTTIWQNPARYESGYLRQFPGYYATGDGGYIDDDGYLFIMGRTDDVINVAGHRLSTGEIEEVVASHSAVAECCVVGAQDELKGQLPVALVIVKNGATISPQQLQQELVALVREQIGALACLKTVVTVARLPKTRSGKILRKIVRNIVDGDSYQVPSTIDDAESLDDIQQAFRQTT
ncbi:AMP-binding protein [Aliidiomarina soli]|uniref:Propionyl-CoA synthetase n=1 Tax=Aliidiomarina soli TaxID=1928574 RepID=A0A432WGP8_9GAMM|nr:AMP-binding protein [Aliidiomarina soli]RUO32933.1 propionyl-CoA synthetase [Aliidiomarina soli]